MTHRTYVLIEIVAWRGAQVIDRAVGGKSSHPPAGWGNADQAIATRRAITWIAPTKWCMQAMRVGARPHRLGDTNTLAEVVARLDMLVSVADLRSL